MSILLAEKNDDKEIIHPIMLTFVVNDCDKYLSMPIGKTNKISDQKVFSSTIGPIERDYKKLFFSADYFFTAIFNCNTFDEKIELPIKGNYLTKLVMCLGSYIGTSKSAKIIK